MSSQPGKVLVTGGAGFIGSHLAAYLLDSGYEVVVLDDLSGGFEENIPPGAIFVKGSILDENLIEHLFQNHRFQYVFHLAAYAAEGLSHFIKNYNYRVNLLGSVNLINASVKYGVQCFVFLSSIAVYGTNQLPMTEDLIPNPEDSYAIAKLAVEQELKITYEMFGMPYIIFRPHNVYGERQNIGDKYRNVIGIFMNRILKGQHIAIYGDGTQTRAFSYIRDIIPPIAQSITMPEVYNQIFNVGTDNYHSVNEVAQLVCHHMGKSVPIEYFPERKEVKHAWCSHEKLTGYFGKQATTPLDEGIKRMAQWAKSTGIRDTKDFPDIEIRKNLPSGW